MKKKITVNFKYSLLIIVFSLCLYGCNEDTYVLEVESMPPVIDSFEPKMGGVGTLITIEGEYLKDVDTITIGSGQAVIKRVINDEKIVLEVTHDSKSGKIVIGNAVGTAESAGDFSFQFVTPIVSEIPETGTINSDVSFHGSDMHGVTSVLFDDVPAKITYQKEDELAVTVPFVPNSEWVTVRLEYNTEAGTKEVIKGPNYGFLVVKPPFAVLSWPTSAYKGSQITILGENINLYDSVMFGDVKAEVITEAASFLTVLAPEYDDRTFVTMAIHYFSDQVIENTSETEIYPQFRKVFDTFEGGADNFIVHRTNGIDDSLRINGDWELIAPEGGNYIHYTQAMSSITGSPTNSVMCYFHYDEGGADKPINMGAFSDPVVHFYYNNKETPTYLQLETKIEGTTMRVYTERLETTTGTDWALYCYRLNSLEWYPAYAPGTPGTVLNPNPAIYEYFRINFKPAANDDVHVNLDYVFISEGAISGAYDLTNWSANSGLNPDKIPPPIVE